MKKTQLKKCYLAMHLSLALFCLQTPAHSKNVEVPKASDLFLTGNFPKAKFINLIERPHGKPLDLSVRRPVVNLKGTVFERKYGKPGYTLVANLYHKKKFFIARVPENGVKDIYFQMWYFDPKIAGKYIAAHTLLRFEMNSNRPVELVAEVPSEKKLKQLSKMSSSQAEQALPREMHNKVLRNVAISAEAQWVKDDPKKEYSLIRGTRGAFVQIVRFVSMEERYLQNFENGENPVAQLKLDRSQSDLNKILMWSFRVSEDDGIRRFYDTIKYNCTTKVFEIINRALGRKVNQSKTLESYARVRFPIASGGEIKKQFGGAYVETLQEDPSLNRDREAARRRFLGK